MKENLRGIIISKGLTVEGVADDLGKSVATIRNWTSRTTEPKIYEFVALAETIGITPEELLRRWIIED